MSDRVYYIALKAYDERNAQSPLSNIAHFGKFMKPGQVTDLQFISQSPSNLTLNFTAPGEDGVLGKVSRFELRYSNDAAVLVNNWSDAEMIDNTHLVAGTLEPVDPG
eukprot:05195.XXX_136415_136791_1 [CDS] Oithona nana genome sequencing.